MHLLKLIFDKLFMEIEVLKNNSIFERREEVSHFLVKHLEQYGDPIEDIERCMNYAIEKGGVLITASKNKIIQGAVVINHTGMSGYIPENILVYIAVSNSARGEGLGKKLMEVAIQETKGDIALHVEKDNPARFLYEKVGFTNPYLEMRYKRK